MQTRQFAPELPLAFGYFLWNLDLHFHIKIATGARAAWQAAFTQTETLSAACPRRNFQAHVTFERRHFQLSPENRLPRINLGLMNQIAAFHAKVWMPRKTNSQEQIAAFSTAFSCFALARETDSLPFAHTARNLDLVGFDFLRPCSPQRNSASRSVQCLLQRHHDVGLDIVSAFCSGRPLAKAAESGTPAAAAKESFEKVAETGPAELELDPAIAAVRKR